MIDKKEFLSTYNMTEEDIALANISWDELMILSIFDTSTKIHLRISSCLVKYL